MPTGADEIAGSPPARNCRNIGSDFTGSSLAALSDPKGGTADRTDDHTAILYRKQRDQQHVRRVRG
jgi:hypothetical protein